MPLYSYQIIKQSLEVQHTRVQLCLFQSERRHLKNIKKKKNAPFSLLLGARLTVQVGGKRKPRSCNEEWSVLFFRRKIHSSMLCQHSTTVFRKYICSGFSSFGSRTAPSSWAKMFWSDGSLLPEGQEEQAASRPSPQDLLPSFSPGKSPTEGHSRNLRTTLLSDYLELQSILSDSTAQ